MKTWSYTAWTLAAIMAAGCSTNRLATGQAARLAVNAMPSYDRETDVEFADVAMAGQLKFLEGLLESAPGDPALLLAAARSYARYTSGFVTLKREQAESCGDALASARLNARAIDFYGRAYGFALRALARSQPAVTAALQGSAEDLDRALAGCAPEHAPALFWTAFALGNLRALQSAQPSQLSDLGRAARIMHRVVILNDTLEWAAPHLYLGAYYARLPAFLGGSRTRSRQHYARALEHTSGQYLVTRLEQTLDQLRLNGDSTAYRTALGEILEAPIDANVAFALDNRIACYRTGLRLDRMETYPLLIHCRAPLQPIAAGP